MSIDMIMGRIIDWAVHKRWLVMLLTVFAGIVGGVSLYHLPIDAVPDITNNQVQVNIRAPALSTELVEKQAAFPIETALSGIAGLEYTRSLSRNGFAQITAVFTDSTDIYFARQQISERLAGIADDLPSGVVPEMGPVATGLGEISHWIVRMERGRDNAKKPGEPGLQADGSYLTPAGERLVSDVDKATYLRTVQAWVITPLVKMVPDVAGVDSIGGYEKQYQIIPDVQRLSSLGLTLNDIAAAVQKNNISLGAGVVNRGGEGISVRLDALARSADDLKDIVITTRGGVPVTLSQVASVNVGQATRMGSASVNGHEAVIGTAVMRTGANSRTVALGVADRLETIGPSLPPDVVIEPVLNRSVLVNATIKTVAKNLTEGALLVIALLFLLLGNFRAALITAAVIPITMLMTGFGMLQTGVSANLMSLGALDFGLIVDGAIIIVENALRRMTDRENTLSRALDHEERLEVVVSATREMVRPSVYGQAIIILVYIPVLMLTGVAGKTFVPMAMTVIIALASAFVLSLTFVPAAIAMWLSSGAKNEENRIIRWLHRKYEPGLDKAMARPMRTIGIGVAGFLVAIPVFLSLGEVFIPQLDEGDLVVQAARIPATSLEQSQEMTLILEKELMKIPEVKEVFSKTGTAELASDPMPPGATDMFIVLKPKREWPNSRLGKAGVIAKVEKAIARVPGSAYEITQPIQMRFNELIAGVRGDIAVKVFGDDFTEMTRTAQQIAAVLQRTKGAVDVKVEQTRGLPMLDIRIKHDAAARLGIGANDIEDVISGTLGGREVGMIFEGDARFPIVIRLSEAERGDLARLAQLQVPVAGGGFVPLSSVADIGVTDGLNQVSRENGKRLVVVQANVRGRDIASVVNDAQAAIAQEIRLPTGSYLEWGGEFENLVSVRERLMLVVPLCFGVILLLLYNALGSARDAAVVFTGVPMAVVGGVLALWLRGMDFSISAAVGFIALSGIAVLNGLVMVSAIQDLMRTKRISRAEAARAGAILRLRPVVMTALVASLGFVPMALATSAGAEVQKPLATVVIGGLVSATLLTLFVLPTLYARYGRRDLEVKGDESCITI